MAGFFGKLPAVGDFVARGLEPGVKSVLDRLLSAHFADRAKAPETWPELGVRAVIEGPEGPLVLVIVPSHDLPGRCFPLACVAPLKGADQEAVDIWADAALEPMWAAIDEGGSAEGLAQAIARLPALPDDPEPMVPPAFWADGHSALRNVEDLQRLFA